MSDSTGTSSAHATSRSSNIEIFAFPLSNCAKNLSDTPESFDNTFLVIPLFVLASLTLRQPFTLQYAREQTPPDIWTNPQFIRRNYTITAVWAIAFAVMVIAESVILYVPTIPPRLGIIVTILAIYGAFRFTANASKP